MVDDLPLKVCLVVETTHVIFPPRGALWFRDRSFRERTELAVPLAARGRPSGRIIRLYLQRL
jgi:hypothetical protein